MREADQLLDTSPVVTVEEAARIARVSPQTIARWLERGWLTNVGSAERPLIAPEDLPIVAAVAPTAPDPPPTNGGGHALPAPVPDTRQLPVTSSEDLARTLLLIRDAWLTPYVEQIAELSRALGRLEAEQHLARERVAFPERDRIADQLEAIASGLAQAEQAQVQVAEQTEQITALAEDVATLQRDAASPDPELEELRHEVVELRRLVSVAWTAIEQRAREEQARASQPRRWWSR